METLSLDSSGRDLFSRAVDRGSLEHLETVVLLGANVNWRQDDEAGLTGLQKAVWVGSMEKLEFLLSKGADANLTDKWGRTPLGRTNSNDVAKILLEHGADPNKADEDGCTPLHDAVMWDNKALIKTLMEGGADPHRADKQGDSPLQMARRRARRGLMHNVNLLKN